MALTTRSYWKRVWHGRETKSVSHVPFAGLFEEYLNWSPGKSAIEFGCIPGDFLVFLNKRFGFKVSGIDFNPETDILVQNFKANGIVDYTFYNLDVRDWKPDIQYDLVCSFGLVEHFQNPMEVIRKHVEAMKSGGLLIIEMPNLRYGQYLLHILLDRESLARHNLNIMDLDTVSEMLSKLGLKVLLADYNSLFGFYIGSKPKDLMPKQGIVRVLQVITNLVSLLDINAPSRFFSPFMVWIARKP